MAAESVVGCAWNGWANQRGITGLMTVERVVERAWNTQWRSASAAARSAFRCMSLLRLSHMSGRTTITALHLAFAKQ